MTKSGRITPSKKYNNLPKTSPGEFFKTGAMRYGGSNSVDPPIPFRNRIGFENRPNTHRYLVLFSSFFC